jgi:C4-dicarboxylate-specific signal transduction histidine kinase
VIWTFLNGRDRSWRSDKATVRDYDIATFVWALVFFARFVVQRWLYDEDQVGWLAVARLGMGYPLMAVALLATVWAVRRADKRLKAAEEAREAEASEEEVLARTADDLLTPDMAELERVVEKESRDKSRD